jgi:phosphate regulon transcriptional regulator PhoB
MKKRILVVDDEKDIVDLIAYNLEKEGYAVLKAYDGEGAVALIKTDKPHLIILDLMLPGIRGLDVCRIIRQNKETESLPVIMLTARTEDVDKILGLEMGADDYITKPFNVKELIARIRAVLRRSEKTGETTAAEIFQFKDLRIHYDSYEVFVKGNRVDLGPTEIKLLWFLSRHPGRVYSRNQLLDYVWGDEAFVEPRTVDVHISRLRGIIEKNTEEPEYIFTIRGIGYKFADIK